MIQASVLPVFTVPLDTCPIYVKAGSAIPAMEPRSYVEEVSLDTLLLDVYPGEGSWDHFLDSGTPGAAEWALLWTLPGKTDHRYRESSDSAALHISGKWQSEVYYRLDRG